MMLRQIYEEVGLPWMKIIVGDVEAVFPVSIYAMDESRIDTLFLAKGNSADIPWTAIFASMTQVRCQS